ncbi:MAG TPA: hypothetical protein VGC79_21175 [Polyangiaceae bacterium]
MASVETTHLNAPPHPLVSRPAQSVEIFASAAPTRPHVDVALLRADGGSYADDTQKMLQSLTERAGQLGCDALFISGASHRPGAPGDLYLFDPGSRQLLGTCMVYLPQSPASAFAAGSAPAPTGNAIVLLPANEHQR